MSFHAKHMDALRAYTEYTEAHPGLGARVAEAMKAHYMDGGLAKPAPYLLLAGLKLLDADRYDQAARALAGHLGLSVAQGEQYLIDAVNRGPAFLKEDEGYLHAKGIMRGATRYFLGAQGIEPGGVYDRAWKEIDLRHRPVLEAALESAWSPNRKGLSKTGLLYVAAGLMPEGGARLFQLNKLSLAHKRKHAEHWREATEYMRGAAARLSITLPHAMLAAPVTRPAREAAPARRPSKTKNQFAGESVRTLAAPTRPRQPANPARRTVQPGAGLKRDLGSLVQAGKISDRAARLYYRLKVTENYGISDAARDLNRTPKEVQGLIAHIDIKLGAVRAANQSSRHTATGMRRAPSVHSNAHLTSRSG